MIVEEHAAIIRLCTRCGSAVSSDPHAKAVHESFHALLESVTWAESGGGSFSVRMATSDYEEAVKDLEKDIRGRD